MGQVLNKATPADVQAGTNDSKYVTPSTLVGGFLDGSLDVVGNSGTFGFDEVGYYTLNCNTYGFVYREEASFCGWVCRNAVAGWQMSVNGWGDFEILKNHPTFAYGITIYAADSSVGFPSSVSCSRIKAGPYTVGTLPTPEASYEGNRTYVTDANAAMSGNFGAVVAGGGSNKVPVFCDGTDWRIG
jgi:hypothetical protein